MPKGLPKSYIKKWGISKLAWRKFRAGALTKGIRTRTRTIKRRIRRSRRTRRKNPGRKRGVRRMVRRYRRKRRRGGKSIQRTAFKLIRLGALVAPGIEIATRNLTTSQKIDRGLQAYTGYSTEQGNWVIGRMVQGWGPYIGAALATYGIPKIINIIRRL